MTKRKAEGDFHATLQDEIEELVQEKAGAGDREEKKKLTAEAPTVMSDLATAQRQRALQRRESI